MHLAPKNEEGKQRILKFVAGLKGKLPMNGTYLLNLDGSADFSWTWANIPKSLQSWTKKQFLKQLDDATKKKDNITYSVEVV